MDGRSGRQARPMDSLSALWVGRDKSPTVCAIGQMRVWSLAPTGKPYKRVLRAKPRDYDPRRVAPVTTQPRKPRREAGFTRLRAHGALLQGHATRAGQRAC